MSYPISPAIAIIANRTPRLVASPAAQDLREPVLGAWRYVRSVASSQAFETALNILFSAASKHRRDDRGGSDFDQEDVIDSDAIERVVEGEDSLNLIRLGGSG